MGLGNRIGLSRMHLFTIWLAECTSWFIKWLFGPFNTPQQPLSSRGKALYETFNVPRLKKNLGKL